MDEAVPEAVGEVLAAHDAFERGADGYRLTTTEIDVTVTASELDDQFAIQLVAQVPTLDRAVAGETVGDAVADHWFETLERRAADAFTVARTEEREEPRVERTDGVVRVDMRVVSADPARAIDDAKALGEFVEGTYLEGLIPGYTYRGVAATLRERAHQRGQEGR